MLLWMVEKAGCAARLVRERGCPEQSHHQSQNRFAA